MDNFPWDLEGGKMFIKLTVIAFVLAIFSTLSFNAAWAETAVTIQVTKSHPSAKEITTIDLIVPPRPVNSLPLKVGDLVFFKLMPPSPLVGFGEGIITRIYDTQDETLKKAIILDHVLLE